MNKKIILLLTPIFLALAAEGTLFAYLTYHFGFLPVTFYYALKSIVGWVGSYYLMGKHQPDPNAQVHYSAILTLENAIHRNAIILFLALTIPGILPTIAVLLFTYLPPLRHFISQLFAAQVRNVITDSFAQQANGFANFSSFTDNFSQQNHCTDASTIHQVDQYRDIYSEKNDDSHDVWQTCQSKENKTNPEKKETIIVDISS